MTDGSFDVAVEIYLNLWDKPRYVINIENLKKAISRRGMVGPLAFTVARKAKHVVILSLSPRAVT